MEKERKKKALPYLEQFRHLKEYLTLAGIQLETDIVFTILYITAGVVDLSFLSYFIYRIWTEYQSITFIVVITFIMITIGYFLLFMILWLLFLILIDYLKFKRRLALEDVLPEFLRLVSTNHRAGLPLDVSLWKANRPRFGILTEEINIVARKTYASGDLIEPLEEFGKKYDSNLLKRVVSNLTEGIKTGADLSSLLDDVSTNITTIKNTRKELASEVENYMLFITITVLIISPFMFGLTYKMSGMIESVKNTLAETMGGDSAAASQIPIQIGFEKSEVGFGHFFDVFVYLMMGTNSVISVLLMSVVKYGNVKQDLKKIPVFYVVGITVYSLSKLLFANFLVI